MVAGKASTPLPPALRASAFSAVAGGALRIASSFTTEAFSAGALAVLYAVIDVLLLAGIAGVWWSRRRTLGYAAMAGLAIFVGGILTIRVAALGVLGADGYQIGAGLALLGLAAYSVETLFRRSAAPWGPLLWLVALACGVVGALGVAPLVLTVAAGVALGAGFVAAGIELLRR